MTSSLSIPSAGMLQVAVTQTTFAEHGQPSDWRCKRTCDGNGAPVGSPKR
eukprot:CAMPEP_0115706792 /NCGR_PEP_ID=MMETSP0272-20121206/70993_1 /TAXON_ID=71861 /ORGANISM="Scrippsiella trochoidea, Strain CCMP3099" /LENGTH=49 /DNA_ID=CAMNT_0003148091 /DNA_START=58 /DNA_END=207 /DNA_ORIENTATION=-